MAILCLAEGIPDLKERLERIVVAFDREQRPVKVGDLYVHGAAAILLKDALMPNLVQTLEGTPALVHGGPFANIAHGHNSVLADRLGLGLGDVVVAEVGFGADLGAEKFVDLVCRQSGLRPDAAVLVVSVRALKHHGGAKRKELTAENPKALAAGMVNLDAHVRILKTLGLAPVVAVNRFASDMDREIDAIVDHCKDLGVRAAAQDRKSTRLNSSHQIISYAVFCLKCTVTTELYTLSLHDALPILTAENPKALAAGMVNLDAHVRILKTLGLAPVVAVNRFASDMDREIDAIVDHCKDLGVRAAA